MALNLYKNFLISSKVFFLDLLHIRDWTNYASHLSSVVVNMIGGPIWPLDDHNNLHFDNEQDIHMSSKNDEATDYGHN